MKDGWLRRWTAAALSESVSPFEKDKNTFWASAPERPSDLDATVTTGIRFKLTVYTDLLAAEFTL